MKSGGCCWSILLFLGSSHALLIEVPQGSVNGTVGQSVLLPVSYRLQPGPFLSPLTIQWCFSNSPNLLITYSVNNCSVSAEGVPTCCSGHNYTFTTYQGRAELFPDNASLLLHNLQLNDSGVYSITFTGSQQPGHITLTVSEPHRNHGNPDSNGNTGPQYLLLVLWITGSLSFLLLLLLLFVLCRQHKSAVQRRKTRIIKQQQVPNHEDLLMESSMPQTISTIYARIGEDTGQRHARLGSQMPPYASLSSSRNPNMDNWC